MSLASYQLTKQMSSFSRKLCFVCSCFECKLSKLPFTTMSRPTTENIYIQHDMNVVWLPMCLRVVSFRKVSLGRKKNPVESVSTARRSLTPCFQNSVVSRQNSRGWKRASLCGQLTGQKVSPVLCKQRRKHTESLKTFSEHRTLFFSNARRHLYRNITCGEVPKNPTFCR